MEALAPGERVPGGGEDGVLCGDDGFHFVATEDEPGMTCPEVAVLGVTGDREGNDAQRALEPRWSCLGDFVRWALL